MWGKLHFRFRGSRLGAVGRASLLAGGMTMIKLQRTGLALGALSVALAGPALADGSLKDPYAPAERKFEWSFNVGATSDYMFRGISQNDTDPALQGGVDISYGIFYAGIFTSMIDFDGAPPADVELDVYAGIKPEWMGVSFDLGVIYYTYPGADDGGAELNFVEFKAGASVSPIDKLTVGATVYYSPEYTLETGEVWTFEGTAAYELRQIMMFTPTISATLGYQVGEGDDFIAIGDDDYLYWNAGLSLAVDKLTLDFRYWDTDIDETGFCVKKSLCDERFVFSAKVTY